MKKVIPAVLAACIFLNPVYALAKAPSNKTDSQCLAEAIYYEARGQSIIGQQAVALVTLNRAKHPNYPKSICGVVYQKNQYSWTRAKKKIREWAVYKRIQNLANAMIQSYNNGVIPKELEKIRTALFFNSSPGIGKGAVRISGHKFYIKAPRIWVASNKPRGYKNVDRRRTQKSITPDFG